MSVLIKGMKMPSGCDDCRFYVDGACYAKKWGDRYDEQDCPLVKVPDHGDLIDRAAALAEIDGFYPPKTKGETEAEEINRVGWECAINCIEAYLRTVPPVIPAERSERGET